METTTEDGESVVVIGETKVLLRVGARRPDRRSRRWRCSRPRLARQGPPHLLPQPSAVPSKSGWSVGFLSLYSASDSGLALRGLARLLRGSEDPRLRAVASALGVLTSCRRRPASSGPWEGVPGGRRQATGTALPATDALTERSRQQRAQPSLLLPEGERPLAPPPMARCWLVHPPPRHRRRSRRRTLGGRCGMPWPWAVDRSSSVSRRPRPWRAAAATIGRRWSCTRRMAGTC